MDTPSVAFGPHLRRLRGARSRREIAAAAGIHPQSLIKIELGMHRPRAETAAALARALGVEIDELFGPLLSTDAAPAPAVAPPPMEAAAVEQMKPRRTPAALAREASSPSTPRRVRGTKAPPLRLAADDHPRSRDRGAGRHAGGEKPRRSAASLAREVARLEVRLRREQSTLERAYSRCVIAGAPLPPAPPGMGARHRAAWERAREREAQVRERLAAARQALAGAQVAERAP